MAEIKHLLYNESLKSFIDILKLTAQQKKDLKEKVPYLNREERVKLLRTLSKIFLLDAKESKDLGRIEKFWQE